MDALYMGHYHNLHQGPYTPTDGPSLPSLRVSSSQSAMPLDSDVRDLPSAPEESAFFMQYGPAALYAQNANPASHEEINASNVFSASENTVHLKSPLKSAHLGSSASVQDPSSGVFLDQPSGNGFGPELDPTVDSRYSENTYMPVFSGDEPMLSPTWNMPGSFKVFNAMDLDIPEQPYSGSSAPLAQALTPQNHDFSVHQNPGQTSGQSDQYPDQYAGQYPSSQYTQANTPFDPTFNATLNPNPNPNPNTLNPNTLNAAFPNPTVDDSSSLDPDLSNLALDPHYLDSSHAFARSLSHSMAESPFSTDRSPQPSPSSYAFPASQGADAPDSVAFSESVLAPGTVLYPETASNGPQTSAFRDFESNRTSISLAANELSPLTTTTSFTASVSSHHSTQQSFFSTQQFWRSSMDLPPSSIHRASMDLYQRRRGSLESSNSGANAPVRSQRSLASYFPFMDRDRKSPIQNPSPPENWQPAMVSAPRHSIRSIFKTSNAPQSVEEEPERPVFSAKSEDDHLDGDEAQKKAKRTTRGLFKRFKQTKQEELRPEEMKQEDGLRFDDFGPVNSSQSDVQLANINMGGYEDAEMDDEPDYGALFSKVGKRKNFGMKNSKKDKEKEKEKTGKVDVAIKMEEAAAASFSSAENSESSHLSATTSGMSATSRETTEYGPTSSFASASKRILGSRLMKKKNHVKNEPLTNVVEIDLQSLDLPENTEVIEKQTSKSRIRGRKEDKAADLEDDSKIYICGYCSRRFKRQEHLKRHFRSLHTAEKPYNCSYCKKKFSRTDNLNQHVKVHKQEEEEQNM